MFKSVFMKYLIVLMVIIFLCFVILTSLMAASVRSYSMRFKEATVENIASTMALYVMRGFGGSASGKDAKTEFTYNEDFQMVVNLLSSESRETAIFVTLASGKVKTFGSTAHMAPDDMFTERAVKTYIPESVNSALAAGERVVDTDDMEGTLKNDCHYAAVPMFRESDGEYVGAVFAATINTGMDKLMRSTVMTLVMASLWIMLASLTAVYIISEKMTTPIRKMSRAARRMAKGDFDVKVEVRGKDEISELAQSFNDMSTSLSNLEYMRSTFVSDVSHELRTPMTSIGGFIDSILDGAIPPEKEKYYLELVSVEIKRLSRLVTNLLEISRLEAGSRKMNYETFDICEMARTVLISNEQRIEEKRLDVSFECDDDNIFVTADRDSIYQCLFNLCDNGIKFSNEGGRYEVTIRKKGEKAVVSVFNEGIGISEEDLPFVFERFYKSDKSRGLDKTGVGLGLYLVKSQINAHGEDIKVESEHGKWCRFTFTLALAEKQPGGRTEKK
ncbi:MAG: HAMP domain-containing histidine kinase [Clostridia bacterium]|nr:HAMP domain-containing histidine kinase [Clostridia bacterium]